MNCADYQAGRCRSCSEIEVPYAEQLRRKQQQAEAALAQFGPRWLSPLGSEQTGFRNKAKMAVGGTLGAPTLGLLDALGQGVDLEQCPLYPPSVRACFAPLRQWLIDSRVAPYDLGTRRGEAKYLLLTEAPGSGELLLRIVLRSREALGRLEKALPMLCAQLPRLTVVSANLLPEHKAVTEGEVEIALWGPPAVQAHVNDITLHLRPRSFFQTHSALAAELYRQARHWLDAQAAQLIWDLYCGVGGFALHLARADRRCIGIESTAEAIDAARESALASGLGQVEFVCADATAWAQAQTRVADAVVVNPPRRGIGAALAQTLNSSGAQHLIYSSCLMESLARDLALLDRYRVVEARMLDLFPHTRHYETIVFLERR